MCNTSNCNTSLKFFYIAWADLQFKTDFTKEDFLIVIANQKGDVKKSMDEFMNSVDGERYCLISELDDTPKTVPVGQYFTFIYKFDGKL